MLSRKYYRMTRRCLGWYGTHTEPRILFDAGEGAQITDGICPDCLKRLDKEARKLIAEDKDNG